MARRAWNAASTATMDADPARNPRRLSLDAIAAF
jgi:hypothetical protein